MTGLLLLASTQANAEVGALLWEDNFNTLDTQNWTVDVGDGCDQGLCGWGNAELQWYSESNAYVLDVPGEIGNKALVLEAISEDSNGYAFTSGKVQSSNKISVQYGMIEVRLQIPDVGIGLWPAAWMLGTTTQSWPAKGEIDMMEMGQSVQSRTDAGFPDAEINNYTGSNLIFYTDAACSDGNPTCAASIAWQNDNAHLSDTPLTNRFVTYRTYWTETEIRFTVEDNGVEYDMFDAPFTISAESDEFQAPFYLLLNLAVGGNFTDAATNDQVTATTPAKMYIDYVRVYELDGQGEVFIGDQTVPEAGTFGVFTDVTPTDNKLEAGQTSDIYVWNTATVEDGTIAANEGENVIAWSYTGSNEWFGGSINTRQARDMSNFAENGEISFDIKIPADVAFKVGIEDTYSNQNWLDFPANTTTYGLVRDGEWATATIPVADMRGTLIALQSLEGMFYIASVDGALPIAPFEMAIDNIVWTGGGEVIVTDSDGDGVADILDNCANTPAGAVVDNNGCEILTVVDTDNDGVNDDDDLCPNTIIGSLVDDNGCPLIVAKSELIQAEDYTNFTDTTSNNIGGEYRSDAVDIQATSDTDGGYNVGWIESGEMLEYALELGAGTYAISTRVASNRTGTYTLSVDGVTINNDTVATNAWQVYETHELGEVTVDAGEHTLTITVDSGNFNINWLNLELIDASVVDADNDGVLDDVDQCLDTSAGTIVDETGCEVIAVEVHGVTETSDSSVEFFVNVTGWADVHYKLNDGGQQNLRMLLTGSGNTYALENVSAGDVITYFYTYQDNDGTVRDSAWATHTVSGASQ
ncbi:family 16 glycosylhydrolase [Colwellia sp. E2M01]|nr:family 16 glycosylhydrolase [Colwellia sp. E2M01]